MKRFGSDMNDLKNIEAPFLKVLLKFTDDLRARVNA